MTDEVYAGRIREFVGLLGDHPVWALAEACDAWVAQHSRQPTPNELLVLVRKSLQPIRDEIADRRRRAEEQAEERESRQRQRCSPEAAAAILAEYGYTARRLDEILGGQANRSPEQPPPVSGTDWREGNELVRRSREARARRDRENGP